MQHTDLSARLTWIIAAMSCLLGGGILWVFWLLQPVHRALPVDEADRFVLPTVLAYQELRQGLVRTDGETLHKSLLRGGLVRLEYAYREDASPGFQCRSWIVQAADVEQAASVFAGEPDRVAGEMGLESGSRSGDAQLPLGQRQSYRLFYENTAVRGFVYVTQQGPLVVGMAASGLPSANELSVQDLLQTHIPRMLNYRLR